jgi:GNAT superfamily N-acetyltransferase
VAALRRMPGFVLMQVALRQLPFTPIDIGKLCFLRLDGRPRVPPALLRGAARVRAATIDDLPGMTALQPKPERFRARFERGDHCVIALIDDRIIGYEWFCQAEEHREASWGLPIAIPSGFVYAYDAYIDPAYRNSGIWVRFKAYLSEWMGETGKRGVLTFVDYGNWPSLRTHLRFGFQPTETVLALKVLGLTMFRHLKGISATVCSLWAYSAVTHHALALRVLHAAVAVRPR